MKYANRIQVSLWIGLGLFLITAVFTFLLYSLVPETPASRGPLLLASFIAILLGSLLCVLFLLRWLLGPYRKLLGEAERAAIIPAAQRSQDEAEFVLETFQSVVAQLDSQRRELKKLSDIASERATSAEKFSERIVASVPSGLIAFDGSGSSIVVNAPGRALLEIDGSALDQPADVLLQSTPRLVEMVRECLATGKLYRREEVETLTRNGTPRRLGAAVAPIDLSTERGDRGVLCLLTDITEVTNLREQVTLKRSLESLGEMSAGLAHEFKNTIATLHGYAQFLQNQPLDERGHLATASLLKEVRNLSEMVSSFLNFARPQPLQLEPVALAGLLRECAQELSSLTAERQVEIDLSIESEREIPADERMLRQALVNLIRNAIEAIPEEATVRRVSVQQSEDRDANGQSWAVVEIADTGAGIPPSDLHRIFIPFFTTKAGGHGVGLALAHRVITEHGGTLEAANRSERGAVFTARLPG